MAQASAPTQAQAQSLAAASSGGQAAGQPSTASAAKLELLIKEAQAAQNAYTAAQESGMPEAILEPLRGAMDAKLATAEQANGLGLTVVPLDDVEWIDITVDGADEIGPGLSLIKGGGAALLREKLVWESSRRCIVIADAAKVVATLGAFPLPVEVVAFGHTATARRIRDAALRLGLAMEPRLRMRNGFPVQTDSGQLIYDLACGALPDPSALAGALKSITGVIDHGLFLGLADEALVGGINGVARLAR